MLGELGDGESVVEGVPQELAQDLIHLMAHQKMIVETRHILSRCHSEDAIVVVGSDVKLRLDILAIDEELENALRNHDPDDPSKYFERLLERLDILVSEQTAACPSRERDTSVHRTCFLSLCKSHSLLLRLCAPLCLLLFVYRIVF